ncbi:MAG: hypothetical protein CM15mP106_8170 [Candidatus Neomarinimicrobiota bacterium]|nr:MAG: hypothetical protein CM15mP106_8170 [Candidatus Neomarinimicrobiota bacterium]
MNDDHGNTIFSALHGQHGIKDKSAKMAFISTDVIILIVKRGSYFIQFSEPCFTMKSSKICLSNLQKNIETSNCSSLFKHENQKAKSFSFFYFL